MNMTCIDRLVLSQYIPHLQYQDLHHTQAAVQQHPAAPDKRQMITLSHQSDYMLWHLLHSEAVWLWLPSIARTQNKA